MPPEPVCHGAFVPHYDFGKGEKSRSCSVFLNGASGTLVTTDVQR